MVWAGRQVKRSEACSDFRFALTVDAYVKEHALVLGGHAWAKAAAMPARRTKARIFRGLADSERRGFVAA